MGKKKTNTNLEGEIRSLIIAKLQAQRVEFSAVDVLCSAALSSLTDTFFEVHIDAGYFHIKVRSYLKNKPYAEIRDSLQDQLNRIVTALSPRASMAYRLLLASRLVTQQNLAEAYELTVDTLVELQDTLEKEGKSLGTRLKFKELKENK